MAGGRRRRDQEARVHRAGIAPFGEDTVDLGFEAQAGGARRSTAGQRSNQQWQVGDSFRRADGVE
jgi:hypothetical protein